MIFVFGMFLGFILGACLMLLFAAVVGALVEQGVAEKLKESK
jgi:hypothetical protein